MAASCCHNTIITRFLMVVISCFLSNPQMYIILSAISPCPEHCILGKVLRRNFNKILYDCIHSGSYFVFPQPIVHILMAFGGSGESDHEHLRKENVAEYGHFTDDN